MIMPNNVVSHLFHRMAVLVSVAAAVCGLSAAEPADLLGELDGLQCYSDGGNSVHCLNIRTGETWKVFDRDGGTERGMGGINADGTKLVCNDGKKIVAINLDGTNEETVADQGVCGFFFLGGDGMEWVGYNGEDGVSGGTSGSTWKVRIDEETNRPIESTREKVLDEQWTAGISNGGTYIGESYRGCLMKNLETGAQIDLKSEVVGTQTCWGQVNPENKPRILCTPGTGHDRIAIYEWDDPNDGGGKLWEHNAGFSRWSSTNEDYCVAHYHRGDGHSGSELFLIKIGLDGEETEEASLGVNGYVGGPWIGTLGGTGVDEGRRSLRGESLRPAEKPAALSLPRLFHGSRNARRGPLFRIDGKALSRVLSSDMPTQSGIFLQVSE